MNITNRGKKWERLNSLWILWSFTFIFGCVGFFWIGGRTGRRKWIISGLIYLLVNFGLIFTTEWLNANNQILYNVVYALIIIGWFAVVVQAFMSRKEYLIRREAVLDLIEATRDTYRNEIREDYFPQENVKKPDDQLSGLSTIQSLQSINNPIIDINTCDEQQLASLPGVGIAIAKKAMEMRAETGGFDSINDFITKFELMPHFSSQIEKMAFTSPVVLPKKDLGSTGRVIDL